MYHDRFNAASQVLIKIEKRVSKKQEHDLWIRFNRYIFGCKYIFEVYLYTLSYQCQWEYMLPSVASICCCLPNFGYSAIVYNACSQPKLLTEFNFIVRRSPLCHFLLCANEIYITCYDQPVFCTPSILALFDDSSEVLDFCNSICQIYENSVSGCEVTAYWV